MVFIGFPRCPAVSFLSKPEDAIVNPLEFHECHETHCCTRVIGKKGRFPSEAGAEG